MLSAFFGTKKAPQDKKSDFKIEDDEEEEDSAFLRSLQINLSRLIAYAQSADVGLQREVAEKLANEAVKPSRQVQIVAYGGLKLLVPLTKSGDEEVQRLSAHALANLSVNADNQEIMSREGAIEMLIELLETNHELTLRQSAKALANLGVNSDNKRKIALAGGIPKLVRLADFDSIPVRIEAIAALANLAVNDANELEIVREGGLPPIVSGIRLCADMLAGDTERQASKVSLSERDFNSLDELAAQCARALRNLSINVENKRRIVELGADVALQSLMTVNNERIAQQARRALRNLEASGSTKK